MSRSRLALVCLMAAAFPARAQRSADSLGAAIDRVFADYAGQAGPGCATGVYNSGRVVFVRGYGLANLEYAAPITPSTPFIVGSVSKQFTAAAIALLAQRGKIGLDDDVRRYVPELPDYGKSITVRQLVHHMSGLRDFWELVGLAGLRYDDGYTANDVLALTTRQQGLNFTPGEQTLYSNTGYIVLGMVVQRASGKSLRAFAEEEIFKPLGMTHTHFHDDHTMLVPGRARSYSRAANGGWMLADWNNDLVGQGGLMTTVEDLAKWDANFETGAVGGAAFLAQQLQRGRLSNGTDLPYAFGLNLGTYRGLAIVEHGGSSGGYRAQITRFPTAHTTVTVLCNFASANASALAQRVADVALGSRLGPPGPALAARQSGRASAPTIDLEAATVARLAGRYYAQELDATYELTAATGALVLHRPRSEPDTLRAVDAATLRGRVGTLRFEQRAGTAAPAFVLDAGRVREVRFVRRP